MDIIIEGNDASEFIRDTNKIRWTCSLKRQYLGTLLFFLLGAIFFINGLTSDSTISSTTYRHVDKFTTEYTTKYDYHLSFGLGIGFMLFAGYFVYLIYRQKRKFFAITEKICARHIKISNDFSIKVNKDIICYRDFEMIREQKWSTFSHYMLFKNDILLFQDDFYVSSIVIPKARLSNNEYADLLNFVKSSFSEKKL